MERNKHVCCNIPLYKNTDREESLIFRSINPLLNVTFYLLRSSRVQHNALYILYIIHSSLPSVELTLLAINPSTKRRH